ncbi:MAG: (d)CMP kinase [Waddliaceae bacterium]|jgi:CMP/dCMP kinase|nr:(d)CMP kinase [Waddliaceae bacterium]MBT3578692.1 (d)CMP kinase [Waddliaceae bacterium]MBT4445411.1 (d)CMP kinase [Waddliaceae bacterium]MBT6928321.1 (d)CMP kinase [Waddliaceae bacterium]MBT7265007.1 (d)CMP kinase [Waddliaceae bacterium]
MIITIDGPAGTGKSTVAKSVAEKLGYTFFDTGAMYRAVTYGLIKNSIPFNDVIAIENYLKEFQYHIETRDGEKHYYIGDEEVTKQIRSPNVTTHVSEVSAAKSVRDAMMTLQRRLGHDVDAVFEGRDMGSVVFDDADVKIYLDATPEIRAQRRYDELVKNDYKSAQYFDKKKVLEDIIRRDTYDSSREHSPLKQPDDAHYIDTTELSIEEIVAEIIALSQG